MYQIYLETNQFRGVSIVNQHRLVNECLKDDIKKMHGLQLKTGVPSK